MPQEQGLWQAESASERPVAKGNHGAVKMRNLEYMGKEARCIVALACGTGCSAPRAVPRPSCKCNVSGYPAAFTGDTSDDYIHKMPARRVRGGTRASRSSIAASPSDVYWHHRVQTWWVLHGESGPSHFPLFYRSITGAHLPIGCMS